MRTNNEDSALASPDLLVLADGMGGHAAGEVASVVALRVFAAMGRGPEQDLNENLLQAGRHARQALVAMSDADPMLESLGTTLICVVSDGEQVRVGHIGDSRVYVLRDSAMYQITTDHTHVQRLIDLGQLSAERARTHPYRAMLLKSLDDHTPGPDLDIIDLQVQAGDRILLCSDGLSDYLTAEEIGAALATEGCDEAAEALIGASLQAGTRDNVTVVVGDVHDTQDPVGDEPEFVGAVGEQIGLSSAAAQALSEALPTMHLDPQAPWQGSGFEASVPTPQDAPDQQDAEGQTREQAPNSVGTPSSVQPAEPEETAEPVEPAVDPGAGDAPATEQELARQGGADPGERASVLPGVAAGAFTAVVLVLLALFLFG